MPLEKENVKKEIFSFMRDGLIALLIVGVILGSIVVYTGNWPPLVVVESGSMMHPQITGTNSGIGFIDPGDLVLVKNVEDESGVVTYVEGSNAVVYEVQNNGTFVTNNKPGAHAGHNTYGAPGDVIIYYKNGMRDTTPIIHRAIVWIEYNQTARGFDVPSLSLYGYNGVLRIHLEDVRAKNLELDFSFMVNNTFVASGAPHSGFITLGDNNPSYDQYGKSDNRGLPDALSRPLEPIREEWLYGKARGEIPWFGAIKLYMGGDGGPSSGSAVPSNSWRNIFLSVGILVGLAVTADMISYLRSRKEEDGTGETVHEDDEEAPDGNEEAPDGNEEALEDKQESPPTEESPPPASPPPTEESDSTE